MLKSDGIILDIDGTIWNTTSIIAKAWNKAISENFPIVKSVDVNILKKEFGKTMKTIADDLFDPLNDEQKLLLMEKCCQSEQKYLLNCDIDLTYDGVIETIKQMSSKIDFYIVSNCQKGYIEVLLKKTGLTQNIKDFECYGNNGNSKADNIFLVCKRNNLKSAIYIGDTQTDYEACQIVKIPFIWASYGFGIPKAFDFKITKFDELKNLFI